MKRLITSLICASILGSTGFCGEPVVPPGMVTIPRGVFRPFFNDNTENIERVKAFCLDAEPVTTGEFLEFVRANPTWRRSQVKRDVADESYLKDWAGDLEPGKVATNTPVTDISWFAAKAYAEWNHKRLPTVMEWEYAASAGYTSPYGATDPAFKADVFKWYSTTSPGQLPAIGGRANFWGVKDIQGLIWEWAADFDANGLGGKSSGPPPEAVCGAGAAGSRDNTDFAAFMRYGFRSSLKSNYCVKNLGFRCAKDL